MTKSALITGISGQDGAYLAELLLDKGYDNNRRAFSTSRLPSTVTGRNRLSTAESELKFLMIRGSAQSSGSCE